MQTLLPIKGFSALTTTLVISAVLSVLAFQAGTSAYLARLAALEAEYAAISNANAYSCAQIALFEMSADWSYVPAVGGDRVRLTADTDCRIQSVEGEGDVRVVTVRSSYRQAHSALRIELERLPSGKPSFRVISFRKI